MRLMHPCIKESFAIKLKKMISISTPARNAPFLQFIFLLFAATACLAQATTRSVSYDSRALLINQERVLLFAGHIHYPRSTPDMWPDLFAKARENGLNVIDTYVFWNEHEEVRGTFDFSGNRDLIKFIELASEAGLYVNLRIGPYVCAEWNFGGFPEWLKEEEGIHFRTWNPAFMREMAKFVTHIVNLVDHLLYENGGNIILLQIENEYGNVQSGYGDNGQKYIDWAVSFAQNLTSKAEWFVCQQGNEPSLINACNGFYCDDWMDSRPALVKNQPGFWMENWTGWFQNWGQNRPTRPTQDLAFAVARFIARGGTYVGYYMFHGGTNFARSAGGPYIITSYDYNAPLDEYGFKNEPKFSHLQALHSVLKRFESTLLYANSTMVSIGKKREVYYYGDFSKDSSSLGFFCNLDTKVDVDYTTPSGLSLTLARWSVTIVQGGSEPSVLYSTSTLETKSTSRKYTHISHLDLKEARMVPEVIGAWRAKTPITHTGPLEQLHTTHDLTDYLSYTTTIPLQADTEESWQVDISQVDDVVSVWVDGQSAGFQPGGGSVSFTVPRLDKDPRQESTLTIVTQTVGLQNYGGKFDDIVRGITGNVSVNGEDISSNTWVHQVGLEGEYKKYYKDKTIFTTLPISKPISDPKNIQGWTWYKTTLPAIPSKKSTDRFALDLSSLGRGNLYVNSHHIGRYWNVTADFYNAASANVTGSIPSKDMFYKHDHSTPIVESNCDYAGLYSFEKCRVDSGMPSQSYYHVPAAWIHEDRDNEIVFFEEMGGCDATRVALLQVERE